MHNLYTSSTNANINDIGGVVIMFDSLGLPKLMTGGGFEPPTLRV